MDPASNTSPSFWKDKLVPSIVGALVGASLTQGVALYSLYKNLEVAQNRDRITQLQASIAQLYTLHSEFGKNTELLISEKVELKFDPKHKQIEVLNIKDPIVREFAKAFLGVEGEFYELHSLVIPKEFLFDNAWNPGSPPLPEVSIELSDDLSNFYEKLHKINRAISESKDIFKRWGRTVPGGEINNLHRIQEILDENIAYISKEKITRLTTRILSEKKRLEEILARIDR